MIEDRSCILLTSEMNNWIKICIVVEPYEDFLKVKDIASKAYDEWWDNDSDETLTDYIRIKLDEENLSYCIFTGLFNEDEEDL